MINPTKVSINGIQSVTPSDGVNNFPFHQVGNTRSGEVFNESTVVVRPPGLVSHPLPAGAFNNGVFTPSQYSQFSAQEVNLETSSHWITLGMRDGRVEALLPPTQSGETLLFAEGNPKNFILQNINGDCWIVAPTQIDLQCGQANALLKIDGSINLLTSSTGAAGGNNVGLMINPSNGISLGNQFGNITINSTGITITAGQCSITLNVDGELDINGLIINIQGMLANIAGTLATTVGIGATPATSCLVAPPGIAPVPGLPSKTVFVGP